MPDTPDILRLRVLLCFLREDEKDCTVTEIARTLGAEHYTVSGPWLLWKRKDLSAENSREDLALPKLVACRRKNILSELPLP